MPRITTDTADWSESGLSITITRGAGAAPARFAGSCGIGRGRRRPVAEQALGEREAGFGVHRRR